MQNVSGTDLLRHCYVLLRRERERERERERGGGGGRERERERERESCTNLARVSAREFKLYDAFCPSDFAPNLCTPIVCFRFSAGGNGLSESSATSDTFAEFSLTCECSMPNVYRPTFVSTLS